MACKRIELSEEIKLCLDTCGYDWMPMIETRECQQCDLNIKRVQPKNSSLARMMLPVARQEKQLLTTGQGTVAYPIDLLKAFLQMAFKKIQIYLNNPEYQESLQAISYVLEFYFKALQSGSKIMGSRQISYDDGDWKWFSHITTGGFQNFKEVLLKKNICNPSILINQNLRLHLSIDKYKSILDQFHETISAIDTMSQSVFEKPSINVPAPYLYKWHFRNMAQGYLLTIILNNTNIQTLNVMRKLYYVIITTKTRNINIVLNFKFKNGMMTVYETSSLINYNQDLTNFNNMSLNSKPVTISRAVLAAAASSKSMSDSRSQLKWDMSMSNFFRYNSCCTVSSSCGTNSDQNFEFMSGSSIFTVIRKKTVSTSICTGCLLLTTDKAIGDPFSPLEYYFSQYFPRVESWISNLEFKLDRLMIHKYELANENAFENLQVDEYASKLKDNLNANNRINCWGHAIGCAIVSFFLSLL